MTMILLDTETTGLNEISVAPLEVQPRIIELAAWKIDPDTLDIVGKLQFVCNPGVPIPPKVTKITGFTDEAVKGEKSFAAKLPTLTEFFLGERILVAHNLPFDRQVLAYELARLDRAYAFPWPPNQICTVESTQDIKGHYLSLADLYRHYYDRDPQQVHRGESDVALLYAVVMRMRDEGRL